MPEAKTITSSIVDNRTRGTAGAYLEKAIQADAKLSIVSAYFTIFAYHKLREKLDGIESLRFLFGEPAFIKSLGGEGNNRRAADVLDDAISVSIEHKLEQRATAIECAEWLREKAEIKSMVKPNFLHGKLYLVENANGVKEGLAGSSNFTVNGLGLGGTPNMELNLIVNDKRDLADLEGWFDEVWNAGPDLVEDVKEKVLDYLNILSAENQPQFIYYKTLFHLFGDFLEQQRDNRLLEEHGDFFDSEIWNMLYDFQKDGVKGAINKINKHNGCIIADSVGLGKTFEALAVIQYFERLNYRVLVMCPKNLAPNWTIYQTAKNNELSRFSRDSFKYNVLYHTDMGRTDGRSGADGIDFDGFKWGNYDLVVIDESHNFRGNPVEKTLDDGSSKMNRAKWLMEKIIKDGLQTKVLLLSATPVNSNLRDLRNQILLMTRGDNSALEESTSIKNISTALEIAQKRFTVSVSRYVFPGNTPDVPRKYYYEGIRRAAKKIGLPFGRDIGFTLHSSKHTSLTDVIDRSGDVKAAQAMGGHTRSTMTQKYLHTNAERVRAAVEKLADE